jgi:hypothetical protein
MSTPRVGSMSTSGLGTLPTVAVAELPRTAVVTRAVNQTRPLMPLYADARPCREALPRPL